MADNRTIFDQLLNGHDDVMITDRVEALFQARRHPQLCVINAAHPYAPSRNAWLLPRDSAWKFYVDGWLRHAITCGEFTRLQKQWL